MSLTVTATICGQPVAGAGHYPCTEAPGHGPLGHGVGHRHDGAYLIKRQDDDDAQLPLLIAFAQWIRDVDPTTTTWSRAKQWAEGALTGTQAQDRLVEALARLNEPPFGHHIKGSPRDGEWHCTCGYGAEDDHFDSAEEHIAKVIISF